jgi:hypothetical protein
MKKMTALLLILLFVSQGLAFPFPAGEKILKEGAANLQKNIEPVKGKLYLTATKLVFESDGLNIQGGNTTLELSKMASAEEGWSKLLGLIPALPNALKITMKDGQVYRFTCYWPSRWKKAVEEQAKFK